MADIFADCTRTIGTIRPLHGVNNGPVCYGGLIDVTAYYRELAIPWVRLHDVNWPHPREVDIPTIFPDFDRDPDDPDSYDFARTDTYLDQVQATGARIVYRLGTSIEHTPRKYFTHPPDDFAKWARICLGIIRHVNHGWAGGGQRGITHWEIWNEPEGHPDTPPERNAMWSGTQEQYCDLYRTAATAIKEFDPTLKVGGPAATGIHPAFVDLFLGYCRDHHAPLDFFSWHIYATHLHEIGDRARWMKAKLVEYGFTDTESHLNEWNHSPHEPGAGSIFGTSNAQVAERLFSRLKGVEGASFAAAALLDMQDAPIDVANYYDGAPTSFWSMFNPYGVPEKAFYAFRAFKRLLDHPLRVAVQLDTTCDGLVAGGGIDHTRRSGCLLVSNVTGEDRQYDVEIALPAEVKRGRCEVGVLDHARNLEMEWIEPIAGQRIRLSRPIPRHSVLLLTLIDEEAE